MRRDGDPGAAPSRRGGNRGDEARARHNRIRIAQLAARLIAEHGLADWSRAKLKAAHQLMLPDRSALPSNEEIERALLEHHALFGGEAHAAALRAQRETALAWMRRLATWEPLLVGGVAAGWATEYTDIRLELVADDPKDVEISLAGAGVPYAALPGPDDRSSASPAAHLLLETDRITVRLAIIPPQQRRNRPRRDDEIRLPAEALQNLMAKESPPAIGGAGQDDDSASHDPAANAK